jgi:multiple sugar transport system permease protein
MKPCSLPQVVSPLAMFIFKQYFDGIPHELEEAAILDARAVFMSTGASGCR